MQFMNLAISPNCITRSYCIQAVAACWAATAWFSGPARCCSQPASRLV